MNRRFALALATITPLLMLVACADGDSEPQTVTETTTVSESETESTSSSAESSETAAATTTASQDNRPRGYTGAPTGDPTPLNRTIARCAKSSEGLYERGTTWFTDGTSGWTEYCSNNFYDGPPPVYEPQPQNTPSPWVQGQIDWADCLESGYSEEECRTMLN